MKRLQSIVALFFGTLLLTVSQHQVHARNYLLWALGLEEDEATQGSNHPMIRGLANRRNNWKTRARIQETRYERREERKQVASAADAAMKGAETHRAGGTDQKLNKKNGKQQNLAHNLRVKVAEKVEEEETADVFTVGVHDSGGITRDMNLQHGRDKNIDQAKARKQNKNQAARAKEHGGGGGGKARKNQDGAGKARKNQDNITGKKKKKQNKDHAVATKRAIEGPPGPGGTSLIDIGGGGKARNNNGGQNKQRKQDDQRKQHQEKNQRKQKQEGNQRKQKQEGHQRQKDGGGGGNQRKQKQEGNQRKQKQDGNQRQKNGGGGGKARNNGKAKNVAGQQNAHQRQNQVHYLKKLAHHRGNQQINTLEFLDRTFGIQTRSYKMNVDVGAGIARDGNGGKNAGARNGKNTKVARDAPGDKNGGAKAKQEDVAKGRQDDEERARKKDNGGGRGGEVARERPEKNAAKAVDKRGRGGGSTAQQRQKENRYEKRVTNREQNQKTRKKNKDDEPTDRTFGGKQVAPIAVSSDMGARNKVARNEGGKANPHKHKLGYNKRKQEKIQREKFLHQKKTKIDKVQLNNSGGQHVGRFNGLR